MRRTLSFAVLILLLLVNNSWARVWYVKPDSTGAVINIQAGIDSCAAGDTVVAMPGVYSGDGNWDLDFKGKPIVVMSASRHDPSITDSTVIDGGSQHRGFYFHSGETNTSILEGLMIINGRHDCGQYCPSPPYGGGIACDSASSPTIRYNKISYCYGQQGGGISCSGFSSPIISNNRIYQCHSYGGGAAIFCTDSSRCIIDNNEIYANRATYDGGGIECLSCSPVIINNRIHDNAAVGLLAAGTSPHFLPPTITRIRIRDRMRLSVGAGGGVVCSGCPSVTISNNRIYQNGADFAGGMGIWGCSGTIRGNEIWENSGEDVLDLESSTVIIVGNSIHGNPDGDGVACWYSPATIDSNYVQGNGNLYGDYPGFGIDIRGSKAIVRSNVIEANTWGGISYGGDSSGTSGTIENNTIADNGHGHGYGGIQCWSAVDIVGNTVKNNVSYHGGGGITCHSSATIRNNIIISNSCWSHQGGGISCDGPSSSIINNTIVGNVAGRGSGICVGAACHAVVSCNIISDNQFYDEVEGLYHDGGGIYSESDSVTISCCDVYDNQGGNYLGLADQTGLNGNFSADPIFCDASYGNYSLHVESPCLSGNHPNGSSCELIGALGRGCEYIATLLQEHHEEANASGIEVAWKLAHVDEHVRFFVLRAEAPSTEYCEIPHVSIDREALSFAFRDVDCKPGAIYRYRIDISNSIDASRGVLFETDPLEMPAARLALHQNFPNPFNPSTSIRYELPVKTVVAVEIYDVAGGRVARLVDGEEDRGPHAAEWRGLDDRGRPVASGVYFYRLTAGKETISKKMVLLR